jgi:predicted phosphodiesterase
MKIQIVSDLHLEFNGPGELFDLPVTGDVLVLAGDIGVACKPSYLYLLEEWADRYAAVVYVAGNHEYYKSDVNKVDTQLYNWGLTVPNMYVAQNDLINVDGVTFIGSTLWTDLSNPLAAMHANSAMNDFRLIKKLTRKFKAEDATDLHITSVNYITDALNKIEGPKVVVTHHAPTFRSIHPQYAGDLLNDAYATDLEDLVARADLWVHGHMHHSIDEKIGDCRVLCNPRGYSGYALNPNFNSGLVHEI